MPLIPGGARKRRRVRGRSLIRASDFTFLGGFRVPANYPQWDRTIARGLTHRYRNGQFRLLSGCKGDPASNGDVNHLFEYSVPTLNTVVANYVDAPITTNYGTSFWAGRVGTYRSVLWDEATQKLYYTYLSDYIADSVSNAIGIATLDDVSPSSSSAVGPYRLNNFSYKATKGACLIPSRIQALIGGGKSICFGFGGYESVVASGPAHMGPALAVVNPAIFDGAADNSAVAGAEVFISHPFNATPNTSPLRGLRDKNTYAPQDGTGNWTPTADNAYFNAGDMIDAGAVWIDTPTKAGFLVFANMSGNGARANITGSTFISSNGSGDGSLHTYDITLDQPLTSASTAFNLFVRNLQNNYNRSNVTAITNGGLTMRIQMESNAQQNGGATPQPGAEVFYGTSYFGSALHMSIMTSMMFCYDPEQVLQKISPLPYATCEPFTGPRGGPIANYFDVYRVLGATFDELTNRLYLLQSGGYVGVYELSA